MTQTPPQQYCLRWNNYQNNLTNVFDQLLQSEAFVDVTLACDGHSVKAHKMVLSACSPFFQTLFFDNPCTHPIVILKDISWEELKAVVEFMYRGEINVSQEQLAPLLKVAEMLKIRGLADVSRGGSGGSGQNGGHHTPGSRGDEGSHRGGGSNESSLSRNGPNPADFMSTSNHDSEPGSPLNSNGHLLNHPLLQGHHHLNSLLNPNGSSTTTSSSAVAAAAHAHALASLHRRKRRKMSTPERTPSPPEDDLDDSNQLEIDSQNGDWNNDHSPRSMTAQDRASSERPSSASHHQRDHQTSGTGALSMSLSSTPTPANTPSLSAAAAAAATVGMSLAGGSGTTSSSLVGSMGPAFLNLHAAAAAAAAVANANSSAGGVPGGAGSGSSGGANGGNNPPSTSSSLASDMDLKPGIVEMIREEERAKMLESSHGWLGPSAASTLTDTYQYQIQNLWQKCWNQNQGGVVHALRFRERGPLKSWRPETMAEAIFAVLRDGLSLSQAARKYDIPYPTFVLYANRVHNMLGPSADGCTGTDLMSDMRPKGRGRPQRILLGSWPEEHIRGVIRAVVFRDTQGGKDDFPFIFNRETGLCLPQTPGGSSSHNGLDMTLGQFGNPFLNPSSSPSNSNSNTAAAQAAANLLHQLQPPTPSTTPHPPSTTSSSSTAGATTSSSSSAGGLQSASNLSSTAGGNSSGNNPHGVNLISLSEHGNSLAVAALQHLQQLQQQGTLNMSSANTPGGGGGGSGGSPTSSNSNSPLHQVLSNAGLLSAQAQRELLALQQRHQQMQQQQQQQNLRRHSTNSRDSSTTASVEDIPTTPLGLLSKRALLASLVNDVNSSVVGKDAGGPTAMITDAEILQIKAELPSSLVGDEEDDEDDAENVNEAIARNNLSKVGGGDEDDEDNDDHHHTSVVSGGVIPLNQGEDDDDADDGGVDEEPFISAFKQSVNNPGQSSTASIGGGGGSGCGRPDQTQIEEQARDFVKFLNRNSTSPLNNKQSDAADESEARNTISGNSNSPKNPRSSSNTGSDSNANSNSSGNNNNNDSPKGSSSTTSSSSSNGNGNNNNGSNCNRSSGNSHNTAQDGHTQEGGGGGGGGGSLGGQGTTTMSMMMASIAPAMDTGVAPAAGGSGGGGGGVGRRASLRAATMASSISSLVGESSGVTGGTCTTTSTATQQAAISTRMRSSSSTTTGAVVGVAAGNEREVNTPSPLNFHQNQAARHHHHHYTERSSLLRHLP